MGYEILARNWRGRRGEIDLVVARGDVIVFCEVKARSGDEFGEPFEAVTASKQARIRRLAVEWLQSEEAHRGRARDQVRFDVASVRGTRVEVFESAF